MKFKQLLNIVHRSSHHFMRMSSLIVVLDIELFFLAPHLDLFLELFVSNPLLYLLNLLNLQITTLRTPFDFFLPSIPWPSLFPFIEPVLYQSSCYVCEQISYLGLGWSRLFPGSPQSFDDWAWDGEECVGKVDWDCREKQEGQGPGQLEADDRELVLGGGR